jgi:hypothetical protein
MAEVKVVADEAPDAKTGTQRQRSGVAFPYYNLEHSVAVAATIYTQGGGACDLAQLAALLKYSGVQNGGFRSRVAAAKTFGLVEQEGDRLRVSDRGKKVVAPVSDADRGQALVDAFLAVELFRKVYEEYRLTTLPPDVGLRNLLKDTFRVVPDRVVPTVKVMLDSADYAGLFSTTGNRTRLILPLGNSAARPEPPPREAHASPVVDADRAPRRNGGGGGGGPGGPGLPEIHPALMGLLRELPPPGTPLSSKRRGEFIGAFTATVGFIYPNEEAGV